MQARTLASKLVATGIAFLSVALLSIAVTLWVTWQLEGGAAAVNEAGRLRMMSWRLAAESTVPGADLDPRIERMDATLALLRSGDPARPLFVPWYDEARRDFDAVLADWAPVREAAARHQPVDFDHVTRLVASIDAFVSSIESRLSYWTTFSRGFQLTMIGLAIGGAVLMMYATHLLVLDPLKRLAAALERVSAGDFDARVEVDRQDEFGQLAIGFNAMAERLRALYQGLETRIAEKTASLEAKRERLAALYEMSMFVAGADDLKGLAQGVAQRARRLARADAVAVRWSGEANERYLLLAHEGLPPSMAEAEQCIQAAACYCGQPPLPGAAGATRAIAIHADAAGGLPHCARAGFHEVLTVPVRLHQRTLGEIDCFWRQPLPPGDEDRSLLEMIASHLAGGIESLRVAAAEREAAIAAERTLLARELHDSIAQSLAFLKIQVELLRSARRKGDEPAADRITDELDAGVRECYGDVRELLLHFRTRTDVEDIAQALATTLSKFRHQTGLTATLQVDGDGVPLPPDVQMQVLHVVQEALWNVRKHAGATQVHLKVQRGATWRFEVEDDGCGFDPQADAGEGHVGLRIMRERAARIGAKVQVHSAPGQGTRVVLSVEPAAAVAPAASAATA
ncbi:type IV pili methyl-accepting chemotaxis transducer N-terminal domain-containing protein [Ideonella sp.]|uniref:type IV pili methyl-accepting chemotaxis transducer N-terminal domain-containing protein n=1 Tax=Ideonella sp. TaxID=1929293 RepID=UPI002B48CB90|nr:type IV pili methyl-accepting chemotaxis transducer N-terminal domain-containing protein [Ideonella sp.]HJV71584.1 type IV pili methyl-accepting chemotaxis transducer N-terminal domain-containing protein [Ideonella sp.]